MYGNTVTYIRNFDTVLHWGPSPPTGGKASRYTADRETTGPLGTLFARTIQRYESPADYCPNLGINSTRIALMISRFTQKSANILGQESGPILALVGT